MPQFEAPFFPSKSNNMHKTVSIVFTHYVVVLLLVLSLEEAAVQLFSPLATKSRQAGSGVLFAVAFSFPPLPVSSGYQSSSQLGLVRSNRKLFGCRKRRLARITKVRDTTPLAEHRLVDHWTSLLMAAASNQEDISEENKVTSKPFPQQQQDKELLPPPIRNVVIAGGGIIGTSLAYYLVNDHWKEMQESDDNNANYTVTIVDPTGKVGSCASGKAGGFLARDWRDGTPLEELHRYGFDLHADLAKELAKVVTTPPENANTNAATTATTNNISNNTTDNLSSSPTRNPTDYRRLTCVAVAVDETSGIDQSGSDQQEQQRIPNKPPSKKLVDLEWVSPDVVLWEDDDSDDITPGVISMGDESTIAQVHPRKLCETMFQSLLPQQAAVANDGNNDNDDDSVTNATASTTTNNINVRFVQGKIMRAITKEDRNNDEQRLVVTGVELDNGNRFDLDVLVVACGPWTYEANDWFVEQPTAAAGDEDDASAAPQLLPDITSVKCHSILVPSSITRTNSSRSGDSESFQQPQQLSHTQAVFFDSNGAIGTDGDLEVYPRPDGDSYVNGFPNYPEGRCLEEPGNEAVEDDKISLLLEAMEFVEQRRRKRHGDSDETETETSSLDQEAVVPRHHTQQVCYWPETPDGLPIIGKIPTIRGAYVAGE